VKNARHPVPPVLIEVDASENRSTRAVLAGLVAGTT